MTEFPKLFEAGRIAGLEVKNRVVVTAVGAPLATTQGEPTDRYTAYYEARARGGAGLIITGVTVVDSETGITEPCLPQLTREDFVPAWRRFAQSIQKYDARVVAQLCHPGKETRSAMIGGRAPVGPSEGKTKFGETIHVLTVEEIERMVQRFARAAELAQKAGLDGVELHCAHGYLLNAFLSPYGNHRTDAYGGSAENRLRIVAEILQGIRDRCGARFPVLVRISAEEFIPGGNTLADGVELAKRLEAAGVDAIDVSVGLQETSHLNREPSSYPQGWKKYIAAAVREAVHIPVIAVNTIKQPAFAEQLLAEGVCDFVGLSRQHLADPEWANKAFSGKADQIRTCISCLACFESIVKGEGLHCTVNPALMREQEFSALRRDGAGRPVAVVGGGPGGMEAARVLALRGFDVTLFEKEAELGGQLLFAEKPPHKEKITWLKEHMRNEVLAAGVRVRTGCEATPETIAALQPVGVFACCGSVPVRPKSIPGIFQENVYSVGEVLSGRAELSGKRICIIGSGLSGLETALFLAVRGCELSIVELKSAIGEGIYFQTLNDVKSRLAETGARITPYAGHGLFCIAPGQVGIRAADGTEQYIPADAVVLSMGVRPRRDVVDGLRARFDRVICVGDANREGRILEAIRDGYTKAFVFEPL